MISNRKKAIFVLIISAMLFSLAAAACLLSTENTKAASKKTYLLKVNKKRNVVTAYKRKLVGGKYKYVPIRAMLVSCGRATNSVNDTPSGRFNVKTRHKWGALYGNVWGRYTVQFYKDYLFHTVPYKKYKKPGSMFVGEYLKLGRKASGGCVRMQFIDEKWLSKTCPKGTKVIVYKSKKSGPLGRPKAATFNKKARKKLARGIYYDPTDPAKKNLGYNLAAPVISVPHSKAVKEGKRFSPLKGVRAKDKRTFQDLSGRIKYTIYKRVEVKNDSAETEDEQTNPEQTNPEETNPEGTVTEENNPDGTVTEENNPEEAVTKDSDSEEIVSEERGLQKADPSEEEDYETEYRWKRVSSVDTSDPGAVYMIKYRCYYKYCSKYTGKKTRLIRITGPEKTEEQTSNE